MRRWNSIVLAIGLTLSGQVAQAATIYSTLLAGNVTREQDAIVIGYARTVGRGEEEGGMIQALAWSFTAPTTVAIDGANIGLIRILLAAVHPRMGPPIPTGSTFTLELCADAGGSPGTVLRSATITGGMPTIRAGDADEYQRQATREDNAVNHPLTRFAFGTTFTIVSGTRYWLVLRGATDTYAGWFRSCQDATSWTPGEAKFQQDAGPWTTNPSYTDNQERNHVFETCAGAFAITAP